MGLGPTCLHDKPHIYCICYKLFPAQAEFSIGFLLYNIWSFEFRMVLQKSFVINWWLGQL